MSDPTADSSGNYVLLTRLADEFAARYRAGERPSLKEYLDRYPALADEIRELFPAMVEIEQVKGDRQEAGEPAPPVPPFQQLGDFRILREVGKGGMGVVYEAEQVSLGRHVALKVLPKKMLIDAKAKRRFEREARSAAKLHHTNIVPVFGVGEQDGLPYYVMQFIQGLGLDEVLEELKHLKKQGGHAGSFTGGELRITRKDISANRVARSLMTGEFQRTRDDQGEPEERDGAAPAAVATGTNATSVRLLGSSGSFTLSSSSMVLPGTSREGGTSQRRQTYWQGVASIGVQVASALEYAHKQGIHHRDIKPSNLLLDTQGTVWVTDFGLAKADDQQNLTHTGDILGTLRYMPPEAFEGRSDGRGDIYSLGLSLYELLAFQPAFQDTDRNRLIKLVMHDEPVRPRKLNEEVPRDLETVVLKAIARDPAHRYQTPRALAEDLQRFIEDRPIRARRASTRERSWRWCRRNPAVASLIALLFAVLGAGLGGVTWKWLEAEQLRKNESEAREAAVASETDAKNERRQAVNHLYRSLVREARATRLARQMGYRKEVFGRLREAMALDTPERDLDQLRQEAVGCLGDFVGLEPTIWDDLPAPLAGEKRNESSTNVISVSPDGKFIAFALQDRTIRIRDVATGAETGKVSGDAWGILFGPDSRTLFGLADGELKTWKAGADGRWAMARSRKQPAGSRIVSLGVGLYLILSGGDENQRIEAFAWEDDKQLGSIILEKNTHIENIYPTRDRKRIVAVGSQDTKPHLFLGDLESGELDLIPWASETVFARFPSWDGHYFAKTDDEGVTLYDLERHQEMPFIQGAGNSLSACFSNDGRYLLFSTVPGHIHFWSLAANHETARLSMPGGSWIPPGLQLSGDDRILAVGRAGERSIRLWNLAGSGEKLYLAGHDRAVPCVAFSPDNELIVSGSKDHRVKIWDARSGVLRHTLIPFQGKPQELAFARDGRYLIVGEFEHGLTAWDLKSYQSIPIVGGPRSDGIWGLHLSPDGRHLAITFVNGGLRIYQIEHGSKPGEPDTTLKLQLVRHIPGQKSNRVRFSPNGKRLAWTDRNFHVCLYDFEQGREVPFPASRQLGGWYNLNWYPDSTHLSFVSEANVGEVWNIATGERVMYFGRPREFQQHISTLSPDGRWFVTSPSGSNAVIWDARTGKRLLTLPEESGVWCYSWSPDNTRVALSLTDGAVVVWDLARVRRHLAELGLDWTDSPPGDGPAPPHERHPETPSAPPSQEQRADAFYREGLHFSNRSPYEAEAALQEALRGYEDLVRQQPDNLQHRKNVARCSNTLAWMLATCSDPKFRNSSRALESAKRAVEMAPKEGFYLNTLGIAQYRAGQWRSAIETFNETMELQKFLTSFDYFFMAMAHWQLGEKEPARKEYENAVEWMEKNQPTHEALVRFRAETEELLPKDIVRLLSLELHGKAQARATVKGNQYEVNVTAVDPTVWHVQLYRHFLDLEEGATYTIRFRAKADVPRSIELYAQRNGAPDWGPIGPEFVLGRSIPITEKWEKYETRFTAKNIAAVNKINFILGQQTGTVWIDDFTVTKEAK
jgi:serine/threonine protein kinase/WD40 repeat protein/tetratricopeptide (TPR) repeat protein